MSSNNNLLNIKEAAELLGVSVSTVRRWCNSGSLPCYRVGHSQYRKFERSVIEKLKCEYFGKDTVNTPNPDSRLISKSIPAQSHPAHYLMHKYWGRKAHNIVNKYISNFTVEGDTVLEPFMGSGVTVIESLKLKRKVIGIDINPMSKFIVENSISQIDINKFISRYSEIVSILKEQYGYLYNTICPHCGCTATIETAIWENNRLIRIKGICPTHGTFIIDATNQDRINYYSCSKLKEQLKRQNKISYPTDKIMKYVKRSGRVTIDELFSDRALIILSTLRDLINETADKDIKQVLLFCFTSMLSNVSRMLPGDKEKATYKSGWVISKFWTPKVHTERNIFLCFQLRYNAIVKGKQELLGLKTSLCKLYTSDASNLSFVKDNSIDYIFTDPPYGESIAYLALSQFWNCWLPNIVDYDHEIIIDPYRSKGYNDYSKRTRAAYAEFYRVLKDKHFMSFTFHNRDLAVWKAILDACIDAGFILETIVLQEQAVTSGTQGINKKNTLTGDFIYNFKKDINNPISAKNQIKNPYDFIKECINNYIDAHDGATPSELYEYLIPIIVRNNAYTDEKGDAINIENILKSSFDYVKTTTNNKIGGAYKWKKRKN